MGLFYNTHMKAPSVAVIIYKNTLPHKIKYRFIKLGDYDSIVNSMSRLTFSLARRENLAWQRMC